MAPAGPGPHPGHLRWAPTLAGPRPPAQPGTPRGHRCCWHGPWHGQLAGCSHSLEEGSQDGEDPKPSLSPRAQPICPGWWEATVPFPHPCHPEGEQPPATGLGLVPPPLHTAIQALLWPSSTSVDYVYNRKICSKNAHSGRDRRGADPSGHTRTPHGAAVKRDSRWGNAQAGFPVPP